MANAIQFYDDKILFGDSEGNNTDKIAFDPNCCCLLGCYGCSGDTPLFLSVRIADVGNLPKCVEADCATLNDTWIKRRTAPNYCTWDYGPIEICGVNGILRTVLYVLAPNYWLRVCHPTSVPYTILFEKNLGPSKPNCITWNDEEVPDALYWDASCLGGSAFVTAL